jgi:hypothetical protein
VSVKFCKIVWVTGSLLYGQSATAVMAEVAPIVFPPEPPVAMTD